MAGFGRAARAPRQPATAVSQPLDCGVTPVNPPSFIIVSGRVCPSLIAQLHSITFTSALALLCFTSTLYTNFYTSFYCSLRLRLITCFIATAKFLFICRVKRMTDRSAASGLALTSLPKLTELTQTVVFGMISVPWRGCIKLSYEQHTPHALFAERSGVPLWHYAAFLFCFILLHSASISLRLTRSFREIHSVALRRRNAKHERRTQRNHFSQFTAETLKNQCFATAWSGFGERFCVSA